MRKTKKAMQLARVAEEKADGQLVWIGGDTVVVQLGDVLDRGDCEIGKPQESGLAASNPTYGRDHLLSHSVPNLISLHFKSAECMWLLMLLHSQPEGC
jgi:hypothetical protein